jgi:hypothetical protein
MGKLGNFDGVARPHGHGLRGDVVSSPLDSRSRRTGTQTVTGEKNGDDEDDSSALDRVGHAPGKTASTPCRTEPVRRQSFCCNKAAESARAADPPPAPVWAEARWPSSSAQLTA